jgi:hypothetical protein
MRRRWLRRKRHNLITLADLPVVLNITNMYALAFVRVCDMAYQLVNQV